MIHRFSSNLMDYRSSNPNFDFHPCKNDGNVDDDQAHALYLASKQRISDNSQDLSNLKLKRTNKD